MQCPAAATSSKSDHDDLVSSLDFFYESPLTRDMCAPLSPSYPLSHFNCRS